MSSKWVWLGFIVVAAVLVFSVWWDRAYNGGEQVGSILILGATALVVVWYADEARRTADETRRLASAAWRPNVVLFVEQDKTPNMDIITNDGPGPARELGIVANHPDGPQLVSRYVSPNRPVPISHEVEESLEWAKAGENDRCVSLCWLDVWGQWLHLQWRYTDGRWVCQGSAPDADCDMWRKHIEELKAAN